MLEKIRESIEPKINELGFKLDDILYEKEGNTWFLRVIIDGHDLITVNDFVTVCNGINPILDNIDLIEESYILDVCSKEKGID